MGEVLETKSSRLLSDIRAVVHRPNVRKMFLPDPGYAIWEVDLKQADAQVVAWEANDIILMDLFTRAASDPTVDLHIENARIIFGACNGKSDPRRQQAKQGVHAANYGSSAKTIAHHLGITIRAAEHFLVKWFAAHPSIRQWHKRVERDLFTTRSVANRFGFRRRYFDRVDGLLPEALAWIPQSTVALTIDRGMLRIEKECPESQILLQVHDSCVGQTPIELFKTTEYRAKLKECFNNPIPYPRPLVIGVDIKWSTKSWGDCEKMEWDETLTIG
ncbi:MAG: hypothetical protein E6R03_03070 [Hyphomicrobiaceae bacterium]|nr:MAG: hypothetical protein E6R03_03070 [Hyphomicrobiaceae bacterium]